ncbi:MAG TPA: alpha/beta hydrolase [Pseudonocardia sp.]|jgi:pimeloyl-ACP methyl ester carboxylesterase|nr:alpha/beta hydrolase [Pseudonocardia sp.]
MVMVADIEFEGSGVRLRGERWAPDGSSRGTVVLLHGGGQTRGSWKRTTQRLAESGWTTIALDLRGHGDSDWAPDGSYSFEAMSGDVLAVCSQVERPGGHAPVLVGASAGGIAIILAMGRRPDAARGLVLVDIAPRIESAGAGRVIGFMAAHTGGFDQLEDVHEALVAYNPERARPFDPDALSRNVRRREDGRWYWHWDPEVVTSFGGHLGEDLGYGALSAAARSITVPTLLVRGRESDVLSEAGARELVDLIPHARFVDAQAGHMVAGDDNDVFTLEVDHFLDTVAGSAQLPQGRG